MAYHYPQDGLCDFIFFTHVTCQDMSDPIRGMFEKPFSVFQNVAPNFRRSRMGISFEQRYAALCYGELQKPRGTAQLRGLLNRNILNYGLLAVTGDPSAILNLMQRLKSLLTTQSTLVIGLRGQYGITTAFSTWIQQLKLDYDILLLHTHISTWNATNWPGTAGASILESSGSHNYSSMKHVISQLEPSYFASRPNLVYMVTASMAVTVFNIPSSQTVTAVHVSTTAYGYGISDYSETCAKGLVTPVQVTPETFMVSGHDGYQIIYDTPQTLEIKINASIAATQTKNIKNKLGMAFFDVDYEDVDAICGGAFATLQRSIKRLIAIG
ncbi:uncharacterized protein LOC135367836 [Ornithodoros turicata]|uniref:uncharacterized protein LOC135367836 n=1 Tax=Ornithodoros turicata TaxID=34597 RepID=UPI003138FF24